MAKQSSVKSVLILCYIPIFLACFGLMLWYLYYLMFLNDNVFITTAYLDEATYAEDDTFFMEINYFNNSKSNGLEAFEVKFNFYTDTQLPEKKEDGTYDTKVMYSSGFQSFNGIQYNYDPYNSFESVFTGHSNHYYNIENAFYYDTEQGGTSFGSLKNQKITDRNEFIFDINGELCLIKPMGEVYTHNNAWVKSYDVYDVSYFLICLYDTIKGLDSGEHIFALDLSKYFFVNLQNENGSFDTEPTNDVNFTFANIKVNITDNGLISSEQSMFGIVMNDSNWTIDNTGREEYWKTETTYYLENDDFTVKYENGGYFAALKSRTINYLTPFRNLNLIVNLDLDNFNINGQKVELKGLTENAFGELEIDEINLTSTQQRDFYVYESSNIICNGDINLKLLETLEVVA